ncbi:MAG: hypothetical protein HUU06_02260 [Planctomycetaceae bacterium]|nr:hypothetical protein [Planctomycetota bacterium]NUN51596.1 hypothetical protein [Planctomycetaceae bacterium]
MDAGEAPGWNASRPNYKVSFLYKGPQLVQKARRNIQELAKAVIRAAIRR